MKSNNAPRDADDSQSVDVSRRKFLAASAVGVAGLGAVGSAAAAPDEHTLVIEGFGPYTSYQFTVGGNLEKSTADGASINSGDEIVGQSAYGAVKGGKDAYTFTGPLYSFDFDESNAINVELDGEPARVGQRPDHTIVIEGFGEFSDYSFTSTEGGYSQSDAYGASVNYGERTNDYGADGAVIGAKDAFTYRGELLAFEFTGGNIRVTVDGKAAHVGQLPDYAMTISTRDPSQPIGYEVRIDGTLRKQVYDDQEGEVDQDLFGYEMTGRVSGDLYDQFTYDGEYQSINSDYPDYIVAYNNFQKVR